MMRDQQSLQLPLRAASSHSQTSELDNQSQEDLRLEKSKNRTSKASKLLGTTELPSQPTASAAPSLRDDASSLKKRKARPSFMKSSLSPFPSAHPDNADSSSGRNTPQLRVRASSPMLGLTGSNTNTNAQDFATGPSSKKTLHPSGSSNALFSYFSSRETASSTDPSAASNNDMLKMSGRPDTASQSVHSKGSKSSKRKLRPPRIDLSLLFPKPKPAGEPLLSPQRMVHSPTPLSAVGEFPRSPPPGGRRYTAAQSPTQSPGMTTTTIGAVGPPPPVPPSAVLRPTSHRSAPTDRSSAISTETNWLDPPPHRTVGTSDMDTALQNYSAMQERQHREEQRQWYLKEQERIRERAAERQREKEKEQQEKERRQQQKQQQQQEEEDARQRQLQEEQEQQRKREREREQEEEQRRQQQQQQERQEKQEKQQEKQHDGSVSSIYSRSQDRAPSSYSKHSDPNSHRMSSGGWSKETYLSPKSRPQMPGRRPSPSPERLPMEPPRHIHSADNKSATSKKSTKSSGSRLTNSDLTTTSVLCLSSSEDEDDDDDETPRNSSKPSAHPVPRESVTTYGDLEAEICTAAAAHPAQARAVKRVDLQRQMSASMRGGTMLRSPTIYRNGSMSSAGRSSSAGWRESSQTQLHLQQKQRSSSAIPTISEPGALSTTTDQFPAPAGGTALLSAREISRRSRVIAVTRQEETLLEAMRQRRGKVTPSLFREARYSQNTINSQLPPTSHPSPAPSSKGTTTPASTSGSSKTNDHNDTDNSDNDNVQVDGAAAAANPATLLGADIDGSGPPSSRDSEYSAEMSFLRLSASIQSPTEEGAAHMMMMDKDGLGSQQPPHHHPSSSSQGAASDAEQKTLNSSASPRTSLGYTESLPSPSTSATSPLTPTLPIHRFSTLSTQSPPPTRPPPAVPTHDQRRHSRRRTDSSEAIVLGEEKSDSKEADEFPIWALGWNHDPNLTTVH